VKQLDLFPGVPSGRIFFDLFGAPIEPGDCFLYCAHCPPNGPELRVGFVERVERDKRGRLTLVATVIVRRHSKAAYRVASNSARIFKNEKTFKLTGTQANAVRMMLGMEPVTSAAVAQLSAPAPAPGESARCAPGAAEQKSSPPPTS
jgi:hypothetical protein